MNKTLSMKNICQLVSQIIKEDTLLDLTLPVSLSFFVPLPLPTVIFGKINYFKTKLNWEKHETCDLSFKERMCYVVTVFGEIFW